LIFFLILFSMMLCSIYLCSLLNWGELIGSMFCNCPSLAGNSVTPFKKKAIALYPKFRSHHLSILKLCNPQHFTLLDCVPRSLEHVVLHTYLYLGNNNVWFFFHLHCLIFVYYIIFCIANLWFEMKVSGKGSNLVSRTLVVACGHIWLI
jgi:hypothetical protein